MIGKALSLAAKIGLGLIVAFLVLAIFGPILEPLFKIGYIMLVGWASFLGRVLPEVAPNPSAIGFAIVCSVLLLWVSQWFLGWFYREYRNLQQADSAWPPAWPWRWTAGIYCGLWLLFLGSMSMTGVTHQVGWLVRSDKPIIENRRPRERWEIRMVAQHLEAACGPNGWNSRAVREACAESLKLNSSRRDEHMNEHWHVVFIETKSGTTEAVFIAYRDPELRNKHGYRRVTREGITEGPITRMSEDIRTFAAKADAHAR